jgi:protoheme IX farnesyltransferase
LHRHFQVKKTRLNTVTNLAAYSKPEPLTRAYFKDYMMLGKFRLSTSVVGTTLIAYCVGVFKTAPEDFSWLVLFGLAMGGMLVTSAANGFNQVIEKDTDKLMSRTQNRPVADGRLSSADALTFSAVCAALGLFALAFLVNGRVAFLSLVSLFVYTLCYTPLKKQTPLAVFVGAIPGALPPAIGWVGAVGNIDYIAILLFLIQFFWQFPHFWAIAWMLEDDYRKAGYTLLPSYEGRSKRNAIQIIVYSVMLLLISLYPILIEFSTIYSMFVIIPLGSFMIYRAILLYKRMTVESAKSLMFASLLYMPCVLLSYLL